MDFTKRLRPGVLRGEITCSIRIWQRPKVKAGNRYLSTGVGQIEVDSIEPIELADVTPELARESGFNGVVDLLKIAKHGSGTNVYLVRFHYVRPGKAPARKKSPSGEKQRKRIAKIVEGFPEAEAKPEGRHMSLQVRKKNFGWFLVDHHGDGRVAINCKGSAQIHDMLKESGAGAFSRAEVPRQQGLGRHLAGRAAGSIGPLASWSARSLRARRAEETGRSARMNGASHEPPARHCE